MAASIFNIQATLICKNATKVELTLQYVFNVTDATVIVDLKDDNETFLRTTSVYSLPVIYITWSDDGPILSYFLSQFNSTPAQYSRNGEYIEPSKV